MTHVIKARNVHQALPLGIDLVNKHSVRRESRNGPVLQIDAPVVTVYERPLERVVFYDERDANPFFHLMESLWMLAGRNDVEFPCRFVKTMSNYSDDGETFNGAYGYRWRKHFGFDQLHEIVYALKENQEDRRQVIGMWDSGHDLGRESKDLPCNMIIPVQVGTDGRLNMRVDNRSNDMIWGAYGANAVHFSYLLEYLAARIGVPVGKLYQSSFNMHFYTENEASSRCLPLGDLVAQDEVWVTDPYERRDVIPFPLVTPGSEDVFDMELHTFLSEPENTSIRYDNAFFKAIAVPMYRAFMAYKDKQDPNRFERAGEILNEMPNSNDWRRAAHDWLERRRRKAIQQKAILSSEERLARAQDDGVVYE